MLFRLSQLTWSCDRQRQARHFRTLTTARHIAALFFLIFSSIEQEDFLTEIPFDIGEANNDKQSAFLEQKWEL